MGYVARMKLGAVASRGVWVLVAVAAACSSDDSGSDDVKCGAGTVLKDGECVVASGGTTSGGAANGGTQSNQSGSQSKAGADSVAGTANGGADGGGETNGGATDGGTGPTPNDGEAGASGEGPGPNPEVLPTRWYVFAHEKGVFAYDTTQFPAPEGLLTLSSKAQYPSYYSVLWSPNGRSVLYGDSGTYYVSELTDVASTPRLMFNSLSYPQIPAPPVSWSADSQSLALATGYSISVLDPAQAAPTLYPLTSTAKSYHWAPAGDRLLYEDASGVHVVRVDHGTPGTPVDLDAGVLSWAPNGTQLVGTKNGEITLTTLSGNTAALQVLTTFNPPPEPAPAPGGAGGEGGTPPVVEPAVNAYPIGFSPDGSKLAFNAGGDGAYKAYTMALEPSPAAPKAVVSGGPSGTNVSCDSWSPDGTLLTCSLAIVDGYSFMGDAAGGAPIRVRESENNGSIGGWTWSPNPAKHQLFGLEWVENASKLLMLDLAKPKTTVLLYNGNTPFSVNSAGSLLTYVANRKVYVVNLAAPLSTPAEIVTDQIGSTQPVPLWSPDGQFISITDDRHQQRLVRVDGVNVSTPLSLQLTGKYTIYGAWQP